MEETEVWEWYRHERSSSPSRPQRGVPSDAIGVRKEERGGPNALQQVPLPRQGSEALLPPWVLRQLGSSTKDILLADCLLKASTTHTGILWTPRWAVLLPDRLYYSPSDAPPPPGSHAARLPPLEGSLRYVALDRIAVRPRARGLSPGPGFSTAPPPGTCAPGPGPRPGLQTTFSIAAGQHVHHFAAASQIHCRIWMNALERAWLGCAAHATRAAPASSTGLGGADLGTVALLEERRLESVPYACVRDVLLTTSESPRWGLRAGVQSAEQKEPMPSPLLDAGGPSSAYAGTPSSLGDPYHDSNASSCCWYRLNLTSAAPLPQRARFWVRVGYQNGGWGAWHAGPSSALSSASTNISMNFEDLGEDRSYSSVRGVLIKALQPRAAVGFFWPLAGVSLTALQGLPLRHLTCNASGRWKLSREKPGAPAGSVHSNASYVMWLPVQDGSEPESGSTAPDAPANNLSAPPRVGKETLRARLHRSRENITNGSSTHARIKERRDGANPALKTQDHATVRQASTHKFTSSTKTPAAMPTPDSAPTPPSSTAADTPSSASAESVCRPAGKPYNASFAEPARAMVPDALSRVNVAVAGSEHNALRHPAPSVHQATRPIVVVARDAACSARASPSTTGVHRHEQDGKRAATMQRSHQPDTPSHAQAASSSATTSLGAAPLAHHPLHLPEATPMAAYTVRIHTSAFQEAGATGSVLLRLQGPDKLIGPFALNASGETGMQGQDPKSSFAQPSNATASASTFARGSIDIFRFKGPSVGQLTTVQLTLEPLALAPASPLSWHIDSVDVSWESTGTVEDGAQTHPNRQACHFPAKCWLSQTHGLCKRLVPGAALQLVDAQKQAGESWFQAEKRRRATAQALHPSAPSPRPKTPKHKIAALFNQASPRTWFAHRPARVSPLVTAFCEQSVQTSPTKASSRALFPSCEEKEAERPRRPANLLISTAVECAPPLVEGASQPVQRGTQSQGTQSQVGRSTGVRQLSKPAAKTPLLSARPLVEPPSQTLSSCSDSSIVVHDKQVQARPGPDKSVAREEQHSTRPGSAPSPAPFLSKVKLWSRGSSVRSEGIQLRLPQRWESELRPRVPRLRLATSLFRPKELPVQPWTPSTLSDASTDSDPTPSKSYRGNRRFGQAKLQRFSSSRAPEVKEPLFSTRPAPAAPTRSATTYQVMLEYAPSSHACASSHHRIMCLELVGAQGRWGPLRLHGSTRPRHGREEYEVGCARGVGPLQYALLHAPRLEGPATHRGISSPLVLRSLRVQDVQAKKAWRLRPEHPDGWKLDAKPRAWEVELDRFVDWEQGASDEAQPSSFAESPGVPRRASVVQAPAVQPPTVHYQVLFFIEAAPRGGDQASIVLGVQGSRPGSNLPALVRQSIELPAVCELAGQQLEVSFEAADVGRVTGCTLQLVDPGQEESLMLLRGVHIAAGNKEKAVFECEEWLSSSDGMELQLELPATTEQSIVPLDSTYRLEIQTSELSGSGLPAGQALALELVGATASSGLVELGREGGRHFGRRQLDVFELDCAQPLGALRCLRVGLSGDGGQRRRKKKWRMRGVRVIDAAGNMVAFDYAGLVGDYYRGGMVEIPASHALAPQLTTLSEPGFHLTVCTARRCGSGTKAKVFIELVGDRGTSQVLELRASDAWHPKSRFASGSSLQFAFPDLQGVGELRCARVATDGSGFFSSWRLDCVRVVHLATGRAWTLPCADWIDKRCLFSRWLPALSGGQGGASGASSYELEYGIGGNMAAPYRHAESFDQPGVGPQVWGGQPASEPKKQTDWVVSEAPGWARSGAASTFTVQNAYNPVYDARRVERAESGGWGARQPHANVWKNPMYGLEG